MELELARVTKNSYRGDIEKMHMTNINILTYYTL